MPRTILLCIVSILFNFSDSSAMRSESLPLPKSSFEANSDSCAMRSESLPLPKSSFEANEDHHYYRAFPHDYLEIFQKMRNAFDKEQTVFKANQEKVVLFTKGIPWEIYKEYLEIKRIFDKNNFRPTGNLYDVIFNPLLMDPRGAIPKEYQFTPKKRLRTLTARAEGSEEAIIDGENVNVLGLESLVLFDYNKAKNWLTEIEETAFQMDVKNVVVTYERKSEYSLLSSFLESQSYLYTPIGSINQCTYIKDLTSKILRYHTSVYHKSDVPCFNIDPRIFHYVESLEKFGVFHFVNGQMHLGITGRISGNLATIDDLSFIMRLQDTSSIIRLLQEVEKFLETKEIRQTKVSVPKFQQEFFRACGYADQVVVTSWDQQEQSTSRQ